MANTSLWSNVTVQVQSALAAAQNITSITAATPGVLTYVGSDTFANGDYVRLAGCSTMYQVDERIWRVANVSVGSDTFELEGSQAAAYTAQGAVTASGSTTGRGTLAAGVAEVTFGTTLAIMTDLQVSGGDFEQIDVTTIHDNIRKSIPGAANPIVFSGACVWDPADAGFVALKAASEGKEKLAFRFTLANSQKVLFLGYVGFTGLPTGQAQQLITTPFNITMFGAATTYSS
jgi:hypothetical protein